jgi:outer membrane protein OmpA-like peptidoglycan-associated protein
MQGDLKRRLLFAAAGATTAAVVASPAAAQDYQRFRPAPGANNYLTVEGASVAPSFTVSPSLWINFGRNPAVTVDDKTGAIKDKIVESMTTLNLMATFGLFDRFEIGADLPLHFTTGELVEQQNLDGFGQGDLRLIPKVRILGDKDESGLGLAIAAPVTLPTGSSKRGMSAATVSVNPRAIVEGRLHPWARLAANFGYRWVPSNEEVDPADQGKVVVKGTEIGNEFTYGAGLGIRPGIESLEILAELFGAAPAEDVQGGDNAKPLEADGAIRYYAGNGIVATLGAGRGIVASLGTPDIRVFTGIAWEPPPSKDTDGDGLMDDVDRCPDDPEDKDDFEDSDGCPDEDNDKDGILDVVDKCPNDPETKNGFDDEDGCPDLGDRDGDGLRDDVDKCPDEPEDKDLFEDEDGCPDPDNDRDGILDTADKCPNDPEDKDGFEDEDGCPEPDNDRDGILDPDDKCPLEPEVINGLDDADGCPDKGVSQVRLTAGKIEILEKVYFDNNKDTIKPVSFGVLNQVASTIKAHSEIKKLRVEGHTDRWGPPEHNLDLSQRRSESVKRYLVSQGVNGDVLEPKGYGFSRPLDPKPNFKADDKNRRVEFVIVDDEGAASPPVIETPAAPAAPAAPAVEDAPPAPPAPATQP